MVNTNHSKTTTIAARNASAQGAPNPNGGKDAQSSSRTGGQPAWLKVLTVEEYESADGKPARRWTQVGVAFPHKEGGGLNVELRCLPLNGRLVILPPDDEDGDRR